jgi:hypothetical protein
MGKFLQFDGKANRPALAVHVRRAEVCRPATLASRFDV